MIPFWSRFLRVVVGVLAVTIGSVAVSAWALDERPGEPSGDPAAAAPLQERAAREVDDCLERARALRSADAPDPFVAVDGQPYLFTTNTAAGNVPVVTPAPGGGGPAVADALPVLPAWAAPGFTWAPAVTQAGDRWVLAFTARHAASGRQCIGVATAPAVAGPYPPADAPLVCDLDRGGSIDPSFVADGGGLWLLYKDDGNCCGWPTTLHSVPLTPDGTALAGEPSDLMAADRPWEGDLVEAPSMKRVGDRWLLLYSANRWDSPDYAVGAAWCASPAGPCEKQADPVLAAGGGLDGPGGVESCRAAAPTATSSPSMPGRRVPSGTATGRRGASRSGTWRWTATRCRSHPCRGAGGDGPQRLGRRTSVRTRFHRSRAAAWLCRCVRSSAVPTERSRAIPCMR